MSQDDPLHPHPGPDLGPDHEPEQVEGVLEGVVQDPATDPEPDPHEQVRLWSTERLQAMITDLEPYTTGALGEISPRHAQMRIAAIRELDRIWQAHTFPEKEPEDEGPDLEAIEARHQEELQELEEALELEAQEMAQRAVQEALWQAEQERLALEQARKEQEERLELERQERVRERVMSGIEELRRRAPGT